jgi:hypothetical protein
MHLSARVRIQTETARLRLTAGRTPSSLGGELRAPPPVLAKRLRHPAPLDGVEKLAPQASKEAQGTQSKSRLRARDQSLSQIIIGRNPGAARLRGRSANLAGVSPAALTLLEQPARQQGGGALLDPLIEKAGNIVPQICRVVQPRQLKAAQGEDRSRKEKIPRWLGSVRAHIDPLGADRNQNILLVILVKYNYNSTSCGYLWKTPGEGSAPGQLRIRACSACAGDYENPDATAPPGEDEEAPDSAEPPEPSGGDSQDQSA